MEIKKASSEVVDVGAIANEIKAKFNGVDRVLTKAQRAMGLQIDAFGRLTTAERWGFSRFSKKRTRVFRPGDIEGKRKTRGRFSPTPRAPSPDAASRRSR